MTKKDYILIAKVIKEVATGWNYDSKYAYVVSTIAVQLAERLEKDNTRFNRDKFLKACEVE